MQLKQSRFTTLEDAVSELKDDIDKAAGEARDRYVTSVQAQDAVYLEKKNQAAAYLALPSEPTDMTDFEYIKAEADAGGKTYLEVATRINNLAIYWNKTISPQIEAIRVTKKDELDALTSPSTIQDAVSISYAAIQALKAI